ncbi:hypothetical protein [Streptomyces europaeiscabiei]|uniref:hypothetical protein n=1 Tax=Streptomyces europaeiscabiei TaxID=146819 RepID=UPI0038F795B6
MSALGQGQKGKRATMAQEKAPQLPQENGAAYEVARDVLLQLIGHATSRVVAGEGEWVAKRDRWTSMLNGLDPRDSDAVQKVLDREAPVLKSMTEDLSQ